MYCECLWRCCRARADTPFVGSTLCLCGGDSPNPPEGQKNLAQFAALTQWLRFLNGCCHSGDGFQLRAWLMQIKWKETELQFQSI